MWKIYIQRSKDAKYIVVMFFKRRRAKGVDHDAFANFIIRGDDIKYDKS